MTETTVQEINVHIQQLSLSDQLWLLEKLAQHIRDRVKDISEYLDENAEKYVNGSSNRSRPAPTRQTTEDIDQDEEVTEQESGIFYLQPDSPLYQDMLEIRQEIKEGKFKLYTHEEVWGE